MNGKICRLCTLEDLVDVGGGAAVQREKIGPVAQQSASFREAAIEVDRRDAGPRGQLHDSSPLADEHRICRHDDSVGLLACHRRECAIDLAWMLCLHESHSHSPGARGILEPLALQPALEVGGIPDRGHLHRFRQDLMQQLQALGVELFREHFKTSQVLAGSAETRDNSCGHDAPGDEDHRDRPGRRFQGARGGRTSRGNDQVRAEIDQLLGHARKALVVACGPSQFERDIATFHVAKIAQSQPQRLDLELAVAGREAGKEADSMDLRHRLCEGSERHGKKDEEVHESTKIRCPRRGRDQWALVTS